MKLILIGGAGSRACDWSAYALLRDNVQHFVEGGEPTACFAALHGLEIAIDTGDCRVDAARLRGEVLRAWYALRTVRLDDAAVSLRTRAILTGCTDVPNAPGTVRAQLVGWTLPIGKRGDALVPETAQPFVAAVLALTERVVDGEMIDVRRYGAAPSFAGAKARAEDAAASAGRPTVLGLALKALAALALVAGCSGGWTPPPKTPPDVDAEQKSTNVERKALEKDREPIEAPPPAYGNKVVRIQARHDAAGTSVRN